MQRIGNECVRNAMGLREYFRRITLMFALIDVYSEYA